MTRQISQTGRPADLATCRAERVETAPAVSLIPTRSRSRRKRRALATASDASRCGDRRQGLVFGRFDHGDDEASRFRPGVNPRRPRDSVGVPSWRGETDRYRSKRDRSPAPRTPTVLTGRQPPYGAVIRKRRRVTTAQTGTDRLEAGRGIDARDRLRGHNVGTGPGESSTDRLRARSTSRLHRETREGPRGTTARRPFAHWLRFQRYSSAD